MTAVEQPLELSLEAYEALAAQAAERGVDLLQYLLDEIEAETGRVGRGRRPCRSRE